MTAKLSEIRDHRSALEFLFGRINYERTRRVPYRTRRFKLDRMRELVTRLGNPERAFPAVHIAGTKGKGSTAVMIASALTAAGLRTGLYTSPHLHRLEERFVIDGQLCSEDELVALLARIHPIVTAMDEEARRRGETQGPTYFEITTAAALLHFQQRRVECAVLEVGLGGRLDSTNICHPVVSVITSISYDHTRQLGKTLASIAREKAGIVKPLVPVVTGVTEQEPLHVIKSIADHHGTELLAQGRDFGYEYLAEVSGWGRPAEPAGVSACGLNYWQRVDNRLNTLERVVIGLLGRHQAANASVALATLGQLQRVGWRVEEPAIRQGLAQALCPARVEILSHKPTIVLDAAHNPASVAALLETVLERYHDSRRLLAFATSVDKEAGVMLDQLLPHFEHVVCTRYLNNPRAVDPAELARLGHEIKRAMSLSNVSIHVRPDPQSTWKLLQSLASPAHVLCVTGSFFLAAEMRQQWEALRPLALGCP
jgi:dihydrofolate synthase/folylpolyglutamate synthase